MWKWLAGVDGWQTHMLFCAHSWRYRSIRAEEWSGPWPSYPWGRRRTRDECWFHFCSADETNSSTTVWAPFAKSPNCASQIVRVSGLSSEYP